MYWWFMNVIYCGDYWNKVKLLEDYGGGSSVCESEVGIDLSFGFIIYTDVIMCMLVEFYEL